MLAVHLDGFHAANEAIETLVLKFDCKEKLDNIMNSIDEYGKVLIRPN